MTLKIQERPDEQRNMTYVLSGRIRSKHVQQLRVLLKQVRRRIVLDLAEIILVDREAVVFLAGCETKGIELRNCPAFIREWIRRERPHKAGRDIPSSES
jgi:hypothetical protein